MRVASNSCAEPILVARERGWLVVFLYKWQVVALNKFGNRKSAFWLCLAFVQRAKYFIQQWPHIPFSPVAVTMFPQLSSTLFPKHSTLFYYVLPPTPIPVAALTPDIPFLMPTTYFKTSLWPV